MSEQSTTAAAPRALPRPATKSGMRLYKAIGHREAILAIEAEAAAAALERVRAALADLFGSATHPSHLSQPMFFAMLDRLAESDA